MRKFQLLPAIFFLKSRADCDIALQLCLENRIQDPERAETLSRRMAELADKFPHIRRHRQRWLVEHLAVGSHHSGQLPAWKQLLETLMSEGLLDAIFATSTVAAGVDFPARTVALLNSDRFNGKEFMPLEATELHQMTGRAGRRGKDHIGFALVIPGKFMDIRRVAQPVQGRTRRGAQPDPDQLLHDPQPAALPHPGSGEGTAPPAAWPPSSTTVPQ